MTEGEEEGGGEGEGGEKFHSCNPTKLLKKLDYHYQQPLQAFLCDVCWGIDSLKGSIIIPGTGTLWNCVL